MRADLYLTTAMAATLGRFEIGRRYGFAPLWPTDPIPLGQVDRYAGIRSTSSSYQAAPVHSQAYRDGQLDIMSSSSQTQISHGNPYTASVSQHGILKAFTHPNVPDFPTAYAHVIPAMKTKTEGRETPVVSWHSANGQSCPAIWNKKDNDNPKIKRFVFMGSDKEFHSGSLDVKQRLQKIFKVPSEHFVTNTKAEPESLEQSMMEFGQKVQQAQKAGYKTEVLFVLRSHGMSEVFKPELTATQKADLHREQARKFSNQRAAFVQDNVKAGDTISDYKRLSDGYDSLRKAYAEGSPFSDLRNTTEHYRKDPNHSDGLSYDDTIWAQSRDTRERKNQMQEQKKQFLPEGDAKGVYIRLGNKRLTKEKFQAMMDRYIPKETRGLVWIDACHSGGWQSLGAGRLKLNVSV
jgi:hypothetical protein